MRYEVIADTPDYIAVSKPSGMLTLRIDSTPSPNPCAAC